MIAPPNAARFCRHGQPELECSLCGAEWEVHPAIVRLCWLAILALLTLTGCGLWKALHALLASPLWAAFTS